METLYSLWFIGWLITVGFMTDSKLFMAEAPWWRIMHICVISAGLWPFILGGQVHRALFPDDAVDS